MRAVEGTEAPETKREVTLDEIASRACAIWRARGRDDGGNVARPSGS